jgi:tartrate dehydratase alpha subunit/fumarate hydratase class I-like protein
MTPREKVVALVKDALIVAETTFREDQVRAYRRAILRERHDGSRWVLETMLENARIAAAKTFPLCADAGRRARDSLQDLPGLPPAERRKRHPGGGQMAAEAAAQLGCTPTIPSLGIGRTHYEATTLMLQAMKDGDLDRQSEFETLVAEMVNATGTGSLGLRGSVTALGSFVRVGPARASGVRIAVCVRAAQSIRGGPPPSSRRQS